LTSPFEMIAQMWLTFFPGLLQVVSEPPTNGRSCGIGALYDVALTRTLGIQEGEFVTPSHIEWVIYKDSYKF
jgi:hypothetical protein